MMSESAYKTFEICEQGFLKGFGNANEKLDQANVGRQKFPPTFVANGYVDVLSTNFVIENRLIHGHKVKPFVTPKVTEVDDEDDFRMLEMQLQLDPLLKKRLFAMEQR
jgi:CMP-N-acetylneuraminic acid synthetase